ncbi:MAG: RnfABCDGE type electron transport complex subunit D, partial [Eubacteriales bacterium]
PAIMAYYFYGLKVFVMLTVSILTAVVCEGLGGLFMRRKKTTLYDLNEVFTGAVIALMLPALDSVLLPVIGSAFAIIVAKLPFGGTKSAPFVPAAAGFAFLCVCWPSEVFNYTVASAQFGAAASNVTGTSIASMLQSGNSLRLNLVSIFDILSGNFPGPMGAGSIMVMLAASIYMLFTRPSALLNTLGYILSCAAIALLFPRGHNLFDLNFQDRFSSLVLELCSGTLVFTALFLLPDPATSPKNNNLHRLYYGIFSGVLCMLMRYFGAFEEGACFALLLSNASWPFIENRLNKYKQPAVNEFNKRRTPMASVKKNGGYADGE